MTKAKRFFKSIKPWVRVVLFVGGAGAAGGGVIWQFGPYLTVSCFHLRRSAGRQNAFQFLRNPTPVKAFRQWAELSSSGLGPRSSAGRQVEWRSHGGATGTAPQTSELIRRHGTGATDAPLSPGTHAAMEPCARLVGSCRSREVCFSRFLVKAVGLISAKLGRPVCRCSCPVWVDAVEKVFLAKFSKAPDAFRAQRREGPHRVSEKRPRTFLAALQSIVAAGKSKKSPFARFLASFDFRLFRQHRS